jgi:hypothetical protein
MVELSNADAGVLGLKVKLRPFTEVIIQTLEALNDPFLLFGSYRFFRFQTFFCRILLSPIPFVLGLVLMSVQ